MSEREVVKCRSGKSLNVGAGSGREVTHRRYVDMLYVKYCEIC